MTLKEVLEFLEFEFTQAELNHEEPKGESVMVLMGALSEAALTPYERINQILAPLLANVLDKRKRCSMLALLGLAKLSITDTFENIVPTKKYPENVPFCEESESKATRLIEQIAASSKELRLSMSPLPEVSMPDSVRHFLMVHYTEFVIHNKMPSIAGRKDASGPFLMLLVARALSRQNPELQDLFYALLGGFLPRLVHEPQLARDLAEELLRAADIDGQRAWGLALSADLYFRQGDFITALCYFIMACDLLRNAGYCSFHLAFDLLTSLQRCLRDLKIPDLEEFVYSFIIQKLRPREHQLRLVTKVHFDSLILARSERTIEEVTKFLDEHIESMMANPNGEIRPWLGVLYSINKTFGALSPELTQYQDRLKAQPSQENADFQAVAGHDYEGLKKIVTERSLAHSKTRYQSDLTIELKETATLAERLIALACERQDYETFALCCSILLDPSLGHTSPSQPVALQRLEEVSEHLPLTNPLQRMTTQLPGFDLLVIVSSFQEVMFGSYDSSSSKWTMTPAPKGSNPLFWRLPPTVAELLAYESRPVGRSNQQQIAYEDDLDQQSGDYEQIKNILDAVRIPVQSNRPLAVALSVDISDYPIQLLIDTAGEFVAPTQMMVNLVAPSYVLADKATEVPQGALGRALLWLPANSGDSAICYIHSKIQDEIENKGLELEISTVIVPENPLTADVLFLCAHGGRAIGEFHALSFDAHDVGETGPERAHIIEPEALVESAKIVVLFVCYGGKFQPAPFEHKKLSLARTLLEKGVQSVVASHWPLDVKIPPVWLPHFLHTLRAGRTVIQAVTEANRAIYHLNKNPGAWAALHLYGNPATRVTC